MIPPSLKRKQSKKRNAAAEENKQKDKLPSHTCVLMRPATSGKVCVCVCVMTYNTEESKSVSKIKEG
jgi:hypothetical protein